MTATANRAGVITEDGVDPLSRNIVPAMPMTQAYLPLMTASALATAGRLGLFEALKDGARELDVVAGVLGADVEATGRLADFLVATGHLRRSGGLLANTAETTRWFTSAGDVDYSSGLSWTADALGIMYDLPAAVVRGRPARSLWDRMEDQPGTGARFSRYMRSFAEHLAPDLVAALPDLPAGGRLLDLGGSHGRHSIAFCRAHPGLSAVIVDIESALTDTQALIDREGLTDRITVRPGDIRDWDWGDDYDVALYLSVAHNMSPAENRANFRHLGKTIKPGGALLIHDYPREVTPALFETAFRLTLLVETGTRTYSYAEFQEFLDEGGFAERRLRTLSPADKGSLIIARR